MKIKRSHLRRLIKEELARVLNESTQDLPRATSKWIAARMKPILELNSGRFQVSFSIAPGERVASMTDVVVDKATLR